MCLTKKKKNNNYNINTCWLNKYWKNTGKEYFKIETNAHYIYVNT